MSNDVIFQFQTCITLQIYSSVKDDNSLLSESCSFDRSINDYLSSTYDDCTVYSHSLTNKKKRPAPNAR